MIDQLGLVGCGLMGGSLTLALKKAGLVRRVVGYSPSAASVQRAISLGAIDAPADSAAQAARNCEVVVVAVPVAATQATLQAIAPQVQARTLVIDVGSTKADVVAAARLALGERMPMFVPCHPIAGKESAGIDHADAGLYQDRQVILTPVEETKAEWIDRAQRIWEAVGSRVRRMTPEAHDGAFAAVSHLPHLVAFAAVHAIAKQPRGAEFLSLAGPGFRDFTRIAAGETRVWRDILLANRQEVLAQSRLLRASLDALEQRMQAGDGEGLEDMIRQASATRSGWRMGQG